MNSLDRYRIIERRQSLIDEILTRAEKHGYASLTDRHRLDDEPEHPLQEAFRHLEEGDANREGRRPHLVAPETMIGRLKSECGKRGWELRFNPQDCTYEVIAPAKRVECQACQGRGRVYAPVHIDDLSQFIKMSLCDACTGTGFILSRVSAIVV